MGPFIDLHTHCPHQSSDRWSLYHLSLEDIIKGRSPVENFGVGLHPWWLERSEDELEELWEKVEQLATSALVIGESGLDRVRSQHIPLALQKTWLQRHLELRPNLPLVLHQVRASSELFSIIPRGHERLLILHDYRGGVQETQEWLKRNCVFSVGYRALKQSAKLKESLSFIPRYLLFVETDDHPISIQEVYQEALNNLPEFSEIEALKQQLRENFTRVFPHLKL